MRITTILTAATTAVLVTGCCGPSPHSKTALYKSSSQTGAYAETTPSDRTYVREQVGTEGDSQSLELYSESLRVGKREVENGSVRLRKTVRTENASQPVELRRETVTIDRQALEDAQRSNANASGAFQDKEIVIELKREEAVVEVQPFVSGRIVAQKRSTTERQDVQRQVRHETVEVIKNGDSKDIIVSERVTQDNQRGDQENKNR